MLKTIKNIFFAAILTLSVLTPLVVELFPIEEDISMLSDFEEEDQKEEKKELELKDLFFFEKKVEACSDKIAINLISEAYKFTILSLSLEIFSPPPEGTLL